VPIEFGHKSFPNLVGPNVDDFDGNVDDSCGVYLRLLSSAFAVNADGLSLAEAVTFRRRSGTGGSFFLLPFEVYAD
jgi:hypothetical protein